MASNAPSDRDRRYRSDDRLLRGEKGGRPGLMGRLFGKSAAEPEDEPDARPAAQGGRRANDYERIGAFLERNSLDPTPDHYALAWEYFVSPHSALGWAVDRAIETEGGLHAHTAEVLLSQHRSRMSAENLTDLIGEANARITEGSRVMEQSREDANAYGRALRSGIDGAGDPDERFESLSELTQSMVRKTAEAEKQLRNAVKQLAQMQSRLTAAEKLAESDALTGLANRRAFEKVLKRGIDSCRENAQPLSVAFCDIDHFKKINDRHGHATGDRVLKYVANLLTQVSGGHCHVARHGGEEFVILLKDHDATRAQAVVDSARAELAARNLTAKDTGAAIGKVSFSAGIATLEPGGDGADLLHRADRALYRAKKDGRNRVYC